MPPMKKKEEKRDHPPRKHAAQYHAPFSFVKGKERRRPCRRRPRATFVAGRTLFFFDNMQKINQPHAIILSLFFPNHSLFLGRQAFAGDERATAIKGRQPTRKARALRKNIKKRKKKGFIRCRRGGRASRARCVCLCPTFCATRRLGRDAALSRQHRVRPRVPHRQGRWRRPRRPLWAGRRRAARQRRRKRARHSRAGYGPCGHCGRLLADRENIFFLKKGGNHRRKKKIYGKQPPSENKKTTQKRQKHINDNNNDSNEKKSACTPTRPHQE